jgi:hypothetical protein
MSRLTIKSAVFTVSMLTVAAGVVIIAVGAVFLDRLDDHMGEHALDYYDLARHYGSLTSTGALVCLAGCVGLALALKYRRGFYAGAWSAAIGFATAIFGLFLFPIHSASGAVYFSLMVVMFGASLIFVLVAAVRYVWYRTL